MPRPPPPCTALTVSGQPNCSPSSITAAGVLDGHASPRDERHAGVARDLPGRQLVAHQGDHLGRRPDPRQAGTRHGRGEVGPFGEEAVAGVHRIAPRDRGPQRRCDRCRGTSRSASRRPGRPRRRRARRRASRRPGSLCTTTACIASRWHARITRTAISPRLATRTRFMASIGPARPDKLAHVRNVASDRTAPVAERRHDLLAEQSHGVQTVGARAAVRTRCGGRPPRRARRHLVTTSAGVPHTPSVIIAGGSRSIATSRSTIAQLGERRPLDADTVEDVGAERRPEVDELLGERPAGERRIVVDGHPDARRHVDVGLVAAAPLQRRRARAPSSRPNDSGG